VTSEQQLLPLVRQRTSRNQHPLANFGTRLKSPCSTDSRRATLPCVSLHSLICPASIIPLGKSFLLGVGDRKLCQSASPNSNVLIELPEVADDGDRYVSYISRWNMGDLALRTLRIWLLILAATAIAAPLAAQDTNVQKPEAGHITGTVTDANGDVLAGATVVLQGPGLKDPQQFLSNDNGFFEFNQLDPGTYRVTITAPDFADWTSPDVVLNPRQYLILTGTKLQVAQVNTTVSVVYTPEEVAVEQVKIEETQRVFGVIPNFYVVYNANPAPLTTKLKFHLALKTSSDAFTVLGVGTLAAINQAGGAPGYGQGWKGYGERFGAAAADGFSDIMIGGAILPSLLRQDPRYYYDGKGTNKSRAFHALSSPFVCRGNNGRLQPNYSSIGGDLGSSALSNLYYPASDRGARLVFQNFFISTGERMLSSLVQEFVLNRITLKQKVKN